MFTACFQKVLRSCDSIGKTPCMGLSVVSQGWVLLHVSLPTQKA